MLNPFAAPNERYLPMLGVPPLPVVGFPPVPFEPELKVPAIDAVAGSRPTAWIDDNHTPAGRRWAAARTAPTLLVAIDQTAVSRWRRRARTDPGR